jgi:hypothetical protein
MTNSAYKFRIHKLPTATWALDYPPGFLWRRSARGEVHPTFDAAVAAFLRYLKADAEIAARR